MPSAALLARLAKLEGGSCAEYLRVVVTPLGQGNATVAALRQAGRIDPRGGYLLVPEIAPDAWDAYALRSQRDLARRIYADPAEVVGAASPGMADQSRSNAPTGTP